MTASIQIMSIAKVIMRVNMKKIKLHWFKSYKMKKVLIYCNAFSSIPPFTHEPPIYES